MESGVVCLAAKVSGERLTPQSRNYSNLPEVLQHVKILPGLQGPSAWRPLASCILGLFALCWLLLSFVQPVKYCFVALQLQLATRLCSSEVRRP